MTSLNWVRQRTRAMKAHYRVGYYMSANGAWKRVNKARFIAEMDAEAYYDRVHVALDYTCGSDPLGRCVIHEEGR